MSQSVTTKLQIVQALEALPPESLTAVAEFVEFLRTKATTPPAGRIVQLGGLWKGYEFSEADIRAARREAWAIGQDLYD